MESYRRSRHLVFWKIGYFHYFLFIYSPMSTPMRGTTHWQPTLCSLLIFYQSNYKLMKNFHSDWKIMERLYDCYLLFSNRIEQIRPKNLFKFIEFRYLICINCYIFQFISETKWNTPRIFTLWNLTKWWILKIGLELVYIYKYSRKKSDIAKEVAETLGIWEVREIARAETWENAESQITVIIAAL